MKVKLEDTALNEHANRYLKRQLGKFYGKESATLTPEQGKLVRTLLMGAEDHGPLSGAAREAVRALRRRL